MAKETDIRHRFLADPKIANKFMDEVEDRLVALEEGGGLPEVTASDNGDVLTVVEGVWGKATPSGGGSNVVFIPTVFDAGESKLTANYADITQALEDGKLPILVLGDSTNTGYAVYNIGVTDDNFGFVYMFAIFMIQNSSVKLQLMQVDSDNAIHTTVRTLSA